MNRGRSSRSGGRTPLHREPVQKKKEGGMGRRKPLSDVTNTKKKISADEGLKKKSHVLQSCAMEEDFLPNSIAEEQFWHNHENCIKAQSLLTSVEYYMKTVVLPALSGEPMDKPGIVSFGEINESIYEDMYKDIELHLESKPSYCSLMTPKSPDLMTPESPESSDSETSLLQLYGYRGHLYTEMDIEDIFTLKPDFDSD